MLFRTEVEDISFSWFTDLELGDWPEWRWRADPQELVHEFLGCELYLSFVGMHFGLTSA